MTSKCRCRRFIPHISNHTYQISVDRGIIFYTEKDALVFTSMLFVAAKMYDVTVTKLCLMLNHIHLQAHCSSKQEYSRFVSWYTSVFTTAYNTETGHQGPIFDSPYGNAPKEENYAFRTNSVYILNNPIVKHLCRNAEDYQWTFFPRPDVCKKALSQFRPSRKLSTAMSLISEAKNRDAVISYSFWNIWEKRLSEQEYAILMQHFIDKYVEIDESRDMLSFGSKEKLLEASHTNAGKEFDIKEYQDCKDYRIYIKMIEQMKKDGIIYPYKLSKECLIREARILLRIPGANKYTVNSVLHCDIDSLFRK